MKLPPAAAYRGRPPGCSRCNRCSAPILFVHNIYTGKAIAVVPIPEVEGTISATRHPGRGLVGWPISAEHPHRHPNHRYLVHQVICPVRPGPVRRARRPQPPLPFQS